MSEKMRTAKEAMSIIANRRLVSAKGVSNPDAYFATILSDVRANHWSEALELADGTTSAEEIAAMVDGADPRTKPPEEAAPVPEQRNACQTCGCHGGGWLYPGDRRSNGTTARVVPCPDCAPDRARLLASSAAPFETEAYDRRYIEQFNEVHT